jgi:hypothetical protein
MPKIFTLIFLSVICLSARAQRWEMGVTAGAAGYMGDLNARNIFQVSGPAFGVFVKRNYTGYVSVKASYMHGWIGAADSTSSYPQNAARNLSFGTSLDELALMGEFNFFEYRPGIDKHAFTPYVFLGLGAVYYTPTAKYLGDKYSLRELMTEGQTKPYSSTALSIPYGIGLKYNFSGKMSLTADMGYRNTSTDFLDDVSGKYAAKGSFTDPVARALSDRTGERTGVYIGSEGSQRGDGRAHDSYMFFSLSLSFTFISDNCYYQNGRY